MEIIPVIDLKGGLVVRARMGQRDQYRPIETPLSPTSRSRRCRARPDRRCFHSAPCMWPISTPSNGPATTTPFSSGSRPRFRALAFWVDNGLAEAGAARARLDDGHLVLGSEAQRDAALVTSLQHDPRVILSLDFRGDTFIGPPALLAMPDLWPQRVIVMTLARVGSGAGPDIERLSQIREMRRRSPHLRGRRRAQQRRPRGVETRRDCRSAGRVLAA